MRNLFAAFVDEEIKRDEVYRRTLRTGISSGGLHRQNAPFSIVLPTSSDGTSDTTSITTPRQLNGLVPMTPGMSIGIATPGLPNILQSSLAANHLTPTTEEHTGLEDKNLHQPDTGDRLSDYFSANPNLQPSEASSESNKLPATPTEIPAGATPTSPVDDKEEKKKISRFGKNFKMTFPKTMKIGRSSIETKPATTTEEKQDEMSDKSSEPGEKVFEDNVFGVVEKLRQEYEEHARSEPDQPPGVGITPSLPSETPILRPPPTTMVIIQEDNPESGGVADLYRGAINVLGKDVEVVEKVAPMWLGDLLLRVCIATTLRPLSKLTFRRTRYPTKKLSRFRSSCSPFRICYPASRVRTGEPLPQIRTPYFG